MTRFVSLGRSLVFGFLLAALVPAAEPTNFDREFSDGVAAIRAGHYAEAIPVLEDAFEQANTFPPSDGRRAEGAIALAAAYQYRGQTDRAEPLYLLARRLLEARGESDGPRVALIFDHLGQLRLEQGRWREAEELLARSRDLHLSEGSSGQLRLANVSRLLGEVYLSEGRIGEARTLLAQVVDVLRGLPKAPAQALAPALRSLAITHSVLGRYDLAEPLLQESLERCREDGSSQTELADSLLALGHLYLLERDTGRALPLLQKAVRILETTDDLHLPDGLNELGSAAFQDRKYAVAREYFLRALEIDERRTPTDHVAIALIQASLAETYLGEGNPEKAAVLIKQSIAGYRIAVGDTHYTLAKLLLVEANIEAAQRRRSEADSHYREALTIYRNTFGAGHPDFLKAQSEYTRFSKKK